MTHYIARYKSGEMKITDKYPFGTGAIYVRYFETMQEVGEYLATYDDGTMVSQHSSKYAALEAEIDEYKTINKRLVERIDRLMETQKHTENMANYYAATMRRIMNVLAVGTIAEATHRQRNEVSRNIVHDIIFALSRQLNTFNETPDDLSDIPF